MIVRWWQVWQRCRRHRVLACMIAGLLLCLVLAWVLPWLLH